MRVRDQHDVNRLGQIGAMMTAAAINRAVTEAEGLGGVPSIKDLAGSEVSG